jgi:hypothetical protein
VKVIDARGREADGRDSIHLLNNFYRARALGDRLMPVVYSPFPRPAPGGARFDVTFRSIEREPVAFQTATLTERSCYAGRENRVREVPLAALGIPTRLAAKEVREVALKLPSDLIAEHTCVVELELRGDSVPPRIGQPMEDSPIPYRAVATRFTFELQAAPPAAQGGASELASRKVEDPALLAKLLRASEALGDGRVTPAQLEQLEREGALEP